jgi:hypothetical protein
MLCNFTANTVSVDVRTYRFVENDTFFIVRNLQIPGFDTIPIPLNGQFFKSGDLLEIRANTNLAVDATLSFTLGQAEEDDA